MPDDHNYVIEVTTWRGDVVARNEDTVQLAPHFTKPTDQELVTTDPNVNDFIRGQANPARGGDFAGGSSIPAEPTVPGPGAAAAVLALLAAVSAPSSPG